MESIVNHSAVGGVGSLDEVSSVVIGLPKIWSKRLYPLHKDGVRFLATTSGSNQLKDALEDSAGRRLQDYNVTYSALGVVKLVHLQQPHQVFGAVAWGIVRFQTLSSLGEENPIRTLGDYSKPSHEGYRNTIELSPREQCVLCDLTPYASNWLERLPEGSISTWEDLTTRFLAQFFPPGRTAKL
ncbi:zinc finger, CCHC-type containing protein [Tanacetum coccineum]